MLRVARLSAITVFFTILGCDTPTAPEPLLGVWTLVELNGQLLPAPTDLGPSPPVLLTDTLIFSLRRRTPLWIANLAFTFRGPSGIPTRREVNLVYRLADGLVVMRFNCLFEDLCPLGFSPLFAALDGDELFFRSVAGYESRRYRRVR